MSGNPRKATPTIREIVTSNEFRIKVKLNNRLLNINTERMKFLFMVYNLQSDNSKAERYFNSKSRIEYHSSLSINLYLLDFELNASPLV